MECIFCQADAIRAECPQPLLSKVEAIMTNDKLQDEMTYQPDYDTG